MFPLWASGNCAKQIQFFVLKRSDLCCLLRIARGRDPRVWYYTQDDRRSCKAAEMSIDVVIVS